MATSNTNGQSNRQTWQSETPTLTPEEWAGWLQSRPTQQFLATLQDSIRATEQAWSNSEFVGDNLEQMALRTVKALGAVEAMKSIYTGILESAHAPQ